MFVELKDADSGKIYSLEMSLEEWNKYDNDLLYAQELLEKCKREKSTENNLTNILDQDLDGSACGSERHTWTYDEIIKLIAAVESHNDELLAVNPRIKKKGWENIINDLLSLGIIVTVAEAKKKWANLIQTYNKVKDNKRKTGRGPTKFNFFEKIDSIIGNNKPSNCSPHSLNIGTLSKSTSASQKEIEKPLNEEASSSNTSTIENEASTSSTSATENEEGDVNKQESTPNCTPKAAKAFRNRKTPNQEYQNSKLRYLKRKEEHLEKMELLKKKREEKKEEREQERQMILKKRLQLEERKILAVENYLALKKEEMKNEPKI